MIVGNILEEFPQKRRLYTRKFKFMGRIFEALKKTKHVPKNDFGKVESIGKRGNLQLCDLVKSLRSGWACFWGLHTTAKCLVISIKEEFHSDQVHEGLLFEDICRGFAGV